jgi:LuxR family maltose regulon positive regulatory protein
LIATKLYVPKLRRGLVTRPRLTAQLRRGAEARLTLLSAPAGFGKTTLLADWLGETPHDDRSVAWLSLDPADNEPASFWTYVVTALQWRRARRWFGCAGAHHLLPGTDRPLADRLLNELAASPGEVWLVLDDFHLVDDHEIGQGMAFLLEHLPPRVHVVLSTRADPDLPLARWRVRGELVEIRSADLRFTSAEAGSYLNEATGLQLSTGRPGPGGAHRGLDCRAAARALSLQGHDDVSGFIARFAGNDRYIVDYLIEEVLEQQPEPVRDFLLESAVLDRLTGPLCDAVTGRDDGRHMLMTLERANLFLVALDDQREWYRYHHLFADVLRARMLSEQPEQVPVVHQRASQWYERHELIEESSGRHWRRGISTAPPT